MTTEPLADAVRRPFFAIAAGVVLGDDSDLRYATPSRILARIAQRAVGSVSPEAMALLARAAASSVERHHGYLTLSSVAHNFAERAALQTNRVLEVDPTGDKIRFPVALVAEWFAGEHLLNHSDLIGELVADRERLERWRYPLLLALESRDASANEAILSTLAAQAPAISGWLLSQSDPFHTATLGSPNGVAVHRRRDEYTLEFLAAYGAIGKGIAPASSRLAIFERGRPNPVWLSTGPAVVHYTWATNRFDDPDVILDPPNAQADPRGRWITGHSSAMSEHPAWTWRHAHDELRSELAAIRSNGQFFDGIPIYERERRWAAALASCGMPGSLNPGAIPLEKLQSPIDVWEKWVASIDEPLPDAPQIALLREIVQDLRDQGLNEFEGPWPMPDNINSSGGWVGSIWSDDATLDRLQRVTESALEIYAAAVDRELPLLAPDLPTRRQLV
jgi:hypothetical protein